MATENSIQIHSYLSPIAFLYGIGVRIRNFLFDKGIIAGEQFSVPVICVGNLAVGGTGKTPHTEYLIRLLKNKYKIAVLSRGYKRKTKGFVLGNEKSSAQTLGDEPFQIYLKFPNIIVAVDEDRKRGISQLLALPESDRPEVILLDDGFQHRYVTPSLSIVLSDYNRLFFQDKLLPAGRLREPQNGIHRADIIVITKCPQDLKPIACRVLESDTKAFAHQHVFFTHITYGDIQPVFPDKIEEKEFHPVKDKSGNILILSGIANPELFIQEAAEYADKFQTMTFPDHHNFTSKDFRKVNDILQKMNIENRYILTTEKDAVRLKEYSFLPEEWKNRLYYLPITIDFNQKKRSAFDEIIEQHIITFQRNSILR